MSKVLIKAAYFSRGDVEYNTGKVEMGELISHLKKAVNNDALPGIDGKAYEKVKHYEPKTASDYFEYATLWLLAKSGVSVDLGGGFCDAEEETTNLINALKQHKSYTIAEEETVSVFVPLIAKRGETPSAANTRCNNEADNLLRKSMITDEFGDEDYDEDDWDEDDD